MKVCWILQVVKKLWFHAKPCADRRVSKRARAAPAILMQEMRSCQVDSFRPQKRGTKYDSQLLTLTKPRSRGIVRARFDKRVASILLYCPERDCAQSTASLFTDAWSCWNEMPRMPFALVKRVNWSFLCTRSHAERAEGRIVLS